MKKFYYRSEYKNSYDEIFYYFDKKNTYSTKVKTLIKLDHDKYKTPSGFRLFTTELVSGGYGLLINPYYTKILPLDIDDISLNLTDTLNRIKHFNTPQISDIEIHKSSNNGIHLYLGFKEYLNVISLINNIKTFFPNVCNGYLFHIEYFGKIVIRVSEKFYNGIKTEYSPYLLYKYNKENSIYEKFETPNYDLNIDVKIRKKNTINLRRG